MTVRNRGALAALAAGAAMLTVAGLVACAGQPAGTVGATEATRLASPSPQPPTTGGPVPVVPGTLPEAADPVPPVGLRIPSIDVSATVNPVGIEADTGEFAVPPSVDQVGWYRYGPGLAADSGSVVIAGHVDSARQGRGAFFRLRELDQGDRLTVTGSDGTEREFRVVAREEYDKSRIPLQRYFARDGQLRLTLITCGGPFDERARRYRDNIVVTAVPAQD